jgi:hypothetical protein
MKVEASAVERIVKIGKAAPTDIRQMTPAHEYSRFPDLAARPTRGDGPTRGAGSYSYFMAGRMSLPGTKRTLLSLRSMSA